MWPFLIEPGGALGPLGLPAYGTLVTAAFAIATWVVHVRSRRIGMEPDRLPLIYLAAALGGLVGARLLYVLVLTPTLLVTNPLGLFAGSGFAYYGGVIGGSLAVFGIARFLGLHGWKLADLLAPSLVLGLGIGRLGCFFAGCCHGAPVSSPRSVAQLGTPLLPESFHGGQIWLLDTPPFVATEFFDGLGRLHDVPLYPTQLWSAAAGIGLYLALSRVWNHRRFDGQVAALMLLIEPVFRAFIESFRADQRGYAWSWEVAASQVPALPGLHLAGSSARAGSDLVVVGLTTSQGIGLAMILLGGVLYWTRRHAGVEPEVPIVREEV